jgi:amino acid adenylation domain-containing protein/non-ribosomal peptide synthase protein (TIGR01720 family)
MSHQDAFEPAEEIAVIGLAGRFPKAQTVEQYWRNLRDGVEAISFFSDEELVAQGVSPEVLREPAIVKAAGAIEEVELFDAAFFGFNPREAEVTDPQQRLFLECAWEALERAGYDPDRYAGRIGLYAGAGLSTYFINNVSANPEAVKRLGMARSIMGNDANYLTTWASYKLNLKGPSLSVQTACSTSLVAIHVACQSLLNGECDMALAGGVSISIPQKTFYQYQEGNINSPDGHCRTFDAGAGGTVGGSGVGIVVLKRLADALDDGDSIQAVIKGSAINNDGALRVGFTAPSVGGQAAVIAEALSVANVEPETISYVEAHGTATPLGDPIEIAALTQAFRSGTEKKGYCAIGSVKTNIGHLDAAAGVAGLIKTVLALKHKEIPPSLHFKEPNPKIDFANSPFYVNAKLSDWKRNGTPRRAGVSSLGIGGTNAHVVLEEAPAVEAAGSARSLHLLLVSARTDSSLERATANLARFMREQPGINLADVAYTLQVGRKSFTHRRAIVCRDAQDALRQLESNAGQRVSTDSQEGGARPVAFMFAGQGSQYVNLAHELYTKESVFRRCVDRCAELLKPELGLDLRGVLYPQESARESAAQLLRQTQITQPALFVIEYALAQMWMSWGVRPAAMIGHSLGEYVAACLAGVFTLEEGLRLVAARGRLMSSLPAGAMLAVNLPEAETRAALSEGLSLAAINGPSRCVISGTIEAVEEFEARMRERGTSCVRLETSHAFHSEMMEPVLEPFSDLLKNTQLKAPRIPFVSNVTGTWITAEEATSPRYWTRHLRQPVEFARGLDTLLEDARRVLLEIGPGQTLTRMAAPRLSGDKAQLAFSTLHGEHSERSDEECVLSTLGQLWSAGATIDWAGYYAGEKRLRVQLPTYPFERQRYWIERPVVTDRQQTRQAETATIESLPADSAQTELVQPEPKPSFTEDSLITDTQADTTNPQNMRQQRILSSLEDIIRDLTGVEFVGVNTEATIFEMGVDSLLLIQVGQAIEDQFSLKIPFRLFFEELSTISALVDYLDLNLPPEAFASEPAPAPDAKPDEAVQSNVHSPRVEPVVSELPLNGNGLVKRNAIEPEASSSALERVIAQQLQIMSQQLEMLRRGDGPAVQMQAASESKDVTPLSAGSNGTSAPRTAAPSNGNVEPKSLSDSDVSDAPQQPKREVFIPFKPLKRENNGQLSEAQRTHLEELIARYTERTRESKRLTQAYRQVWADPRNSQVFRQQWKEIAYPIVVRRSSGSRIWDVDGNEYVDLAMGFGVNLFGHTPAFIKDALAEQLSDGIPIGPQSHQAGQVAALINELTGMERVVFCNSGTEAVMTAIRMARTTTRRNKIAIFAGSYHGSFDGTLARAMTVRGIQQSVPMSPGIPPSMVEDVLVLDYGRPESLALIEQHAHELAAVLVEPVQSRRPTLQPREFLHELRALTEKTGVTLIFDEVITGFRIHPGGAQSFFDVRADIATYGKVIGGGMPIGAVAGRAEYLDTMDGGMWSFGDDSYPQAGQTFFAGTFCKHPLAMAAAHAVLQHLKEEGPSLQQRLNERTAQLVGQLNAHFESCDAAIRVEHFSSLFQFNFRDDVKLGELLSFHLVEKGVYVWEGSTRFLSTAHTEQDVEIITRAIMESVDEMQRGGVLPVSDNGPGVKLPSPAQSNGIKSQSEVTRKGESKDGVRRLPLTETQRQLWVLAQLGDDVSRAYNESVTLHLRGKLNPDALGRALQKIVERHEALRTTFSPDGDTQLIHDTLRLDTSLADYSDQPESARRTIVAERVRDEASRAFDLTRGPLLRACIIKVEEEYHQLILTGHHIVSDARSFGVLINELNLIYSADCQGQEVELPELMQYSEFAQFELSRAESSPEQEAADEAFWLEHFSGSIEPLRLPTDRPREGLPTYRGSRYCVAFEPEFCRALKSFNARRGSTLFMTLLAGFNVLLRQLANQTDVVVGINAAAEQAMGNRAMIGFRLHPLALRSRIDDELTFSAYLRSVRTTLLDAYEHQEFPTIKLAKKLRQQGGQNLQSLVSVAFNVDHSGDAPNFFGLEVDVVSTANGSAKLDLYLNITDIHDELQLECDYNSDLFEEQTVERWFKLYRNILEAMVQNPEQQLSTARGLAQSPSAYGLESAETGAIASTAQALNLTPLQLAIWAGQKVNPDVPSYTNAGYQIISARIEPAHFRAAFQALLNQSDALRMVFEEQDGTPRQRVVAGMSYEVELLDFSGFAEPRAHFLQWAQERCLLPLNLNERVYDGVLVKLGEEAYAFYINVHHIIADAWSTMILLRRFSENYERSLKGQLEEAVGLPRYQDFIEGEHRRVGSAEYLKAKTYWEEKLAEKSEPLALYGQSPARQTKRVHRVSYDLGQARTQKLTEVARSLFGASTEATYLHLFAALLSAYLYRVGGNRHLSLGVPFHNRLSKSLKESIGLFIQIMPLRVTIDENETIFELARRISTELHQALRQRDYPVASTSRNQAYDVMIDFINTQPIGERFGGLEVSQSGWLHTGYGNEALNLQIHDFASRGSLSLEIDLSSDIFAGELSDRAVGHLVRLLDSFLENPAEPLRSLDLLSVEERERMLVDFNRTERAFALDQSFSERFEAEVAKAPNQTAVTDKAQGLTYGQLNERANQLAHELQALNVGPESLVALLTRRNVDLLVSILAIFKTGAAYLPLDPFSPTARMAQVLEQSRSRLVLASNEFAGEVSQALAGGLPMPVRPQLKSLDELLGRGGLTTNLSVETSPEELSYVIYTSGSTGLPKGAMIEQSGMLNHLYAKIEELELTAADVIAQTASQSFDISVWQLLAALLVGGRVHVVEDEDTHDPRRLLSLLESAGITIFETVPSMLRSILDEASEGGKRPALDALRWLIVTGEALPPELCRRWLELYPDIPLLNAYGPTECSDDVTHYAIRTSPALSEARVPIGTPVANMQLYILDGSLRPVALGVPGELCVGGVGVGRGYLNDPERTAAIFIPDPYGAKAGARLYRTGDLARQLPDGRIEFLGRIDHQVKIRGFRIELEEIESVLTQHEDVREAVVIASEELGEGKRLVAYIVPVQEAAPSVRALRAFLRERLPEYMTPQAFVTLDEIPLTSNGKVDRRRLPAPALRSESEEDFAAPRNRAEEILAEVWCKVLGLERVGIYDNFFELGGDSILSIQVASKANQSGLRIAPMQIFQHQTIADLAEVADTVTATQAEQSIVTGSVPLTPIQQWFFEQQIVSPHHWNQAVLLHSRETLDAGVLEQTVAHLLTHHDALRLRFLRDGETWQQVNDPVAVDLPFTLIDLSEVEESEQAAAIEAAAREAQVSLDLEQGPLVRVVLMQLGEGRGSRLLFVIHHLVVDGVSWRILFEDIETLYKQLIRGEVVTLPAKTTSFKGWAERLAEYARSEKLYEERDYWMEQAGLEVSPLPLDTPGGLNTVASVGAVVEALSVEETESLLQEVPKAYRTQINDVLLTALAQAFGEWTGDSRLLLALEGHGREEIFDGLDVSRTIGFFTSTHPVLLECSDVGNPGGALMSVKEQLRAIPQHGIGHGVLRYLSGDAKVCEQLKAAMSPEVVFNYLGQVDHVLPASAPFFLARESSGPVCDERGIRPRLLDINAAIMGGRLRIEWSYSQNLYERETIERLAASYTEALRELIEHCLSPDAGGYTASDFAPFQWSQADLDQITSVLNGSGK